MMTDLPLGTMEAADQWNKNWQPRFVFSETCTLKSKVTPSLGPDGIREPGFTL